ncbi:hypothetical protein PTNB73_06788 [Pyrenophora teres f. teres]|nr:hypothetical protein HRS9139_07550 [Pyrenophora teres f. teres]KAE8830931.1 hypothetical protein PTNB85_07518 [Pyrenophora teres f. teres]KAE8863581.1 hypothetical protein PTNB73_06788 [Pyrenophora teres f. teres]
MSTSSFPNLPDDVLFDILTQLKGVSDTTQDLTSCSLVSRGWREGVTSLLYGNIALTHNNLIRFCKHLNVGRYAAYIHSITISLQPDGNIEQVLQLAPLLPHFSNLRSFSFWLGKGYHSIVPHSTLVQLVDALPPSCANLELDTFGSDARVEGDATHLCDSLRRIIPRMYHVRLRVRSCEMIFTDPSTSDQMIRLPYLKSFIYNCARPSGTPLPTCRYPYLSPITHRHPEFLWNTVTNNLQNLVATPNAVPPEAQVYAFTTTDRNDNDLSLWQAHIRANMRAQTSLALPHRAVWMEAMIRGSYVLRLHDGTEVMSVPGNIQAIAEGQMWREVRGGARLPAAVLADARAGKASFAVGCTENPLAYLKTGTQWREENPRKKIRTWVNEEKVGIRLVGAEVRKGKDEYLSLEMVREITPEGWRRVGMNDVLEEIGT